MCRAWGAVLLLALRLASATSPSCDTLISSGAWATPECNLDCIHSGTTNCQTSSTLTCDLGYYSSSGSTTRTCTRQINCVSPCPSTGKCDYIGNVILGGNDFSCELCPAGNFCSDSTKVPCPPGTYQDRFGATNSSYCKPCPPGTYSNSTGATSISTCLPCPIGTWSSLEQASDVSMCSLCKIDTFNKASGSTTASACLNCTINTFSGPGSGVCVSTGSWSAPFSTTVVPCPIGTFNDAPRANSSAWCKPCPSGKWQDNRGSSSCKNAGKGNFTFANSTDTVGPTLQSLCSVGTFSPSEGRSQCNLCDYGSYAERNGSASCSYCPRDYYSAVKGSISRSDCKHCPYGRGTFSFPGSLEMCYPLFVVCPSGLEPKSASVVVKGITNSEKECEFLECSAWSFLSTTTDDIDINGTGCLGCPVSTFGSTHNNQCRPCASTEFCPGFLPSPILPFVTNASLLALSFAAAVPAPRCNIVSLLEKRPLADFSTKQIAILPFDQTSSGSLLFLTSTIVVALVCLIWFTLGYLNNSMFRNFDFFYKGTRVDHGSERLKDKKSTLGGLCSSLLIIAFVASSIYIILLFNFSNVTSSTALDIMTGSLLFSGAENLFLNQSTPWAAINVKAPSQSSRTSAASLPQPLSGSSVNLQLRLYGQSALGCNATVPNSLQSHGDFSGSWDVSVTDDCGGGVSMLTLSCVACTFKSDSALSFELPFTCQAFLLEAFSVDATGDIISLRYPETASALISDDNFNKELEGQLLSTVTWSLEVVGSVVNDLFNVRDKSVTARGYRIVHSSSTLTRRAPAAGRILPKSSAVFVNIELPLQTVVLITTLTPIQTLAQVLTSIVGLTGLSSLFAIAFGRSKYCWSRFKFPRFKPRKQSTRRLVKEPRHAEMTTTGNPLRAPQVFEISVSSPSVLTNVTPTARPSELPDGWSVGGVDDESGACWYVNNSTNETTWELPARSEQAAHGGTSPTARPRLSSSVVGAANTDDGAESGGDGDGDSVGSDSDSDDTDTTAEESGGDGGSNAQTEASAKTLTQPTTASSGWNHQLYSRFSAASSRIDGEAANRPNVPAGLFFIQEGQRVYTTPIQTRADLTKQPNH